MALTLMDDSTRVTRSTLTADDYIKGVLSFDRQVLARCITLVESSNPAHREMATEVLSALLPHTGKARRIGISGVPGVGKSTFIESLGSKLVNESNKVAVLAVDPSSSVTGGSILGDKTRMQTLSAHPSAYIRPSPTSGALGGVTRMTRETMLICEAAGFDVLLIETVGVGQSEITVASMVDFYLVLMLPGAGDELQGIKKGILEIADMIAVNKADPGNQQPAEIAAAAYRRALQIMTPLSPNWTPPVLTCSALHQDGLDRLWQQINNYYSRLGDNGEVAANREKQNTDWLWATIEQHLIQDIRNHPAMQAPLSEALSDMASCRITAGAAADRLVSLYRNL